MGGADEALAVEFQGHRPHLFAVAYRLTGSRFDAEDAVQEAWLRLARLGDDNRAAVRDLRGWLITAVGRLGLDKLRSAAARRERYVGPWLPEPLVTDLQHEYRRHPRALVADNGGERVCVHLGLLFPPWPGDAEHPPMARRVITFAVRDGRLAALYDVVNPDKLTGLPV